MYKKHLHEPLHKNMVCQRCITSVEQILQANNIKAKNTRLGEVELVGALTSNKHQALGTALENVGFELLDDQKTQQIEKLKNLLIQKVQQGDIEEHLALQSFFLRKFARTTLILASYFRK